MSTKRVRQVTNAEYIMGAADSFVNGMKAAINIWSGLLLTAFLQFSKENYVKLSGYLVVLQFVLIPLCFFLARLTDRVKNIKKFAALVYFPANFLPIILTFPLAYFVPSVSDGIKIVFVVSLNLMINIFQSLNGNVWTLMDIRLTPDDRERSYFFTIRNLVSGAVSSLGAPATWITIFLFKALVPFPQDSVDASAYFYFYGTLLFAVLAVPVTMVYLKVRKIRIETPPREKPENIIMIAKAMIKNKSLWLRRLSLLLVAWGTLSGSAYAILVAKYYHGVTFNLFGYIFVPDIATLMLIFSCTQTIPSMISIPLALKLRKKISDKNLILTTLLYSAAGMLIGYVLLTDMLFTTTLMQRFFIHLAAYGWGGIIFGFNVCGSIIDYELIDYVEWQSGQRNECTYNFIVDNIQKVFTLPITYFAAVLLIKTGYNTNSGENITEESTRRGLVTLAMLIPAVFNVLGAIPLFFYKFSGKRREKILAELKERRGGIKKDMLRPLTAGESDINMYML